MRVIAIADETTLVGKLDEAEGEGVDLVLSLGDLWDSAITKAMARYQCQKVFAIKGNHDSDGAFPTGVTNLHLTIETHAGIRFGGFKGCWKYKPRGHHLFSQWDVSEALRDFPAVDVFIAHNSPAGLHERDTDVHRGFTGFVEYIERTKPTYFIHGHQHLSRVTKCGGTHVIGVYGEQVLALDLLLEERAVESFTPFDFED